MTRQKDTRNNWVTIMFVCKSRYNCLRKQSVMDDCTAAFKEFERFGFQYSEIGYGGNHVHFSVDVPKKYSIEVAEIMLKSRSSQRIFEKHPNFRKRYPRGSFWSGYEHHESTGRKDLEASNRYIRSQQEHHKIQVIDDRQKKLDLFVAETGVRLDQRA
ncbi:transposase [Candidatus Woesearchaeota archaeon]|nr:transposase [Candidatus Woesearchaeota archaeon]